ncbi:MAG TPA: hypothetical protein VKT49_25920 [Bryobacteraceae bacterium]|nr:hypothetical protein [Bryobacteraceae bacterium]
MQSAAEPQRKVTDVYLANVELPLSADYYPAGFPLHLSTNSRDVLESARESWGAWVWEFDRPPLRLRVAVQSEGSLAPPAAFRRQGHLFCAISDADNFGVGDLRLLEACIFVSAQTVADHAWFRWFLLEPLVYVLLAQRYAIPVHAACVARQGSGVLLCGASGAGKSTLAFACGRAGWTFVSDDATWLLPEGEDPIGIGRFQQARFRPDAPTLFPELAAYSERVRPNGKLSLEVDLREIPHIAAAGKCAIEQLVMLDRRTGIPPRLEKIRAEQVVEALLQDGPGYGEDVDRLAEKTLRKLLRLPASRLHYERLDDALELLSRL